MLLVLGQDWLALLLRKTISDQNSNLRRLWRILEWVKSSDLVPLDEAFIDRRFVISRGTSDRTEEFRHSNTPVMTVEMNYTVEYTLRALISRVIYCRWRPGAESGPMISLRLRSGQLPHYRCLVLGVLLALGIRSASRTLSQ